jgi:hypothetical protein
MTFAFRIKKPLQMKKIILFILLITIISCAPKRMSCYGKRCVEILKTTTTNKIS